MPRYRQKRAWRTAGIALLSVFFLAGCSRAEIEDNLRFGWPVGITDQAEKMRILWSWSCVAALAVGVLLQVHGGGDQQGRNRLKGAAAHLIGNAQDFRDGNGGGQRRSDERDAGDDFEDDFDFGRRNDMPTRSVYEQPQAGGDADAGASLQEGEPGQEGESFLTDDRQDERGEDRPRGQRRQQPQRKPRNGERDGNRQERGDRPERAERPARAERTERAERPERAEGSADRAEKPARTRRPRKSAADSDGEQRGIDSSILPPSIRGDDSGPNNGGDSGTLEIVE